MLASSASMKTFMFDGEEGKIDHIEGTVQSGRMEDVVVMTSNPLWNKPQLSLF